MTTHDTAEEKAVHQRIEELVAGICSMDIDALKTLYAADVISFDVEPPLQHVGLRAKMDNWVRAFAAFQKLDYEIRNLSVTAGDDVAFGHGFGRLSGTLRNGVATNGMWVRATFCFRKVDGAWRIVHDQASVPFDVVHGTAVTDLTP
jgi:ketosteroid isomerase-like protein